MLNSQRCAYLMTTFNISTLKIQRENQKNDILLLSFFTYVAFLLNFLQKLFFFYNFLSLSQCFFYLFFFFRKICFFPPLSSVKIRPANKYIFIRFYQGSSKSTWVSGLKIAVLYSERNSGVCLGFLSVLMGVSILFRERQVRNVIYYGRAKSCCSDPGNENVLDLSLFHGRPLPWLR